MPKASDSYLSENSDVNGNGFKCRGSWWMPESVLCVYNR